MRRALQGVRVLDFTWEFSGPWATRLLAILGAEVIKVEWFQPGLRYHQNRFAERHVTETALNNNPFFSGNHINKKSVTLNLRTPLGLDLVKQLLRVSDIVIENFSSDIFEKRGLGFEAMQALKPDIVYLSMAGLGHTGRDHEYKTQGGHVQALSGLTQLSGLPGREPAGWGWAYMDDMSGMHTALCAMAALHYRDVTGKGQYVDLAQVSVGMTLTGAAWLDYMVNGRPTRRAGFPPGNRTHAPDAPLLNTYRGPAAAPHNAYRTLPGSGPVQNAWCVIACFSDDEWRRLAEVMGKPQWMLKSRFQTVLGRLEHQLSLDRQIEEWTSTLDKYEVMRRCQLAGVHAMPVQDVKDQLECDPQLRARGMLQELPHPIIGPFTYTRLPFKATGMDLDLQTAGPLAGEHNVAVLCELLGLSREALRQGYLDGTFWPREIPLEPYLLTALGEPGSTAAASAFAESTPRPEQGSSAAPTSPAAFAGLRVLEVGDVKGQWTAKLLGDLGADVIKVEPLEGSRERQVGPFFRDVPHPDRSLAFWQSNTSKRGITLNLETEDGRRLLRRLIPTVDVLIESFAPGYLAALGLGYEELHKLNTRLVMCSVTPFGQSGPWRDHLASDLLLQAAGGFMALCGYSEPDAPPLAPTGGQAWLVGGVYACIAIAAAVCQRDRTGIGQYLDVSIHEACCATTQNNVPDYLSLGEVKYLRQPGGPASSRPTPKSQFRCRNDTWVTLSWSTRMTPDHLTLLAYWMDEHGLAEDLLDERYRDTAVLWSSTDHLADVLTRFFESIGAEEAYHGAQQRGFAAGAIRTVEDIVQDPHWRDRGFLVDVVHPELGATFTYPGAYAIFSRTPWTLSRRAPGLGEHNAEVFAELGIDAARLTALREAHIV
jgi:crotonobetainyl-CoA:carnitine CoA-transferase CaiB-like acyl-CoA transferase